MHELILHHYDFSNFSEKIRLIMGLKNLEWRSVEIPAFAPKPDYTPLTGGYRRTPALQIGADIYCDTQLIADTLEQREPAASLFAGPNPDRLRALSHALAPWAENRLLWPIALYISGIHADRFPREFHLDRARLHHKPPPDVGRVKAAAARSLAEVKVQLARLNDLVPENSLFLFSDVPGLADLLLYHPPWLLEAIGDRSPLIDALTRLRPWMDRVAAIGHGRHTGMDSHEALKLAREAHPIPLVQRDDDPLPGGIRTGDPVVVTPLDEESPATGKLQYLDDAQIVLNVRNDRIGEIHVHFPRTGYRLKSVS